MHVRLGPRLVANHVFVGLLSVALSSPLILRVGSELAIPRFCCRGELGSRPHLFLPAESDLALTI